MTATVRASTPGHEDVPLCVLFGPDLTRNRPATEAWLGGVRRQPGLLLTALVAPLGGSRRFAQEVLGRTDPSDYTPAWREAAVARLREARRSGRRTILLDAGGSPRHAQAAAEQLGIVDEVFHRDSQEQLLEAARSRWVTGFDLIRGPGIREAAALDEAARRVVEIDADARSGSVRPLIRALRPHQWLKNALVFLPVLAAQQFDRPEVIFLALAAFLAFSLTASSIYIVNDLLDLKQDRAHPSKRARPFASGALPLGAAPWLVLGLLGGAWALALLALPPLFWLTLGAYLALTFAYSFRLKGAVLIDVMTLAALYTLRVLAGAAATGITPSVWLLGFSFFFFTSLAMVKRYAELHQTMGRGTVDPHKALPGRSYRPADLPVLIALGVGTGCISVLVLALYTISDEFSKHYRYAFLLWQLCPLVLYWIGRAWIVVARDEMDDDPVVWAVRDRLSRVVAVLVVAILVLAR